MCIFCENIAKNGKEFFDNRLNGGDFIFKDEEGFGILIDTGDSGCLGYINNINFCPMCGRKLTEIENIAELKPIIHAHAIIDCLGNPKCSNCGSANIDVTEPYCQRCGANLDEPKERID